jgi:hypothetical protein
MSLHSSFWWDMSKVTLNIVAPPPPPFPNTGMTAYAVRDQDAKLFIWRKFITSACKVINMVISEMSCNSEFEIVKWEIRQNINFLITGPIL